MERFRRRRKNDRKELKERKEYRKSNWRMHLRPVDLSRFAEFLL